MSKLKSFRCLVDLKSKDPDITNRVIIIVQAGRPGQAEAKIYFMFDGSHCMPYLVGTPAEMKPSEQLELLTT